MALRIFTGGPGNRGPIEDQVRIFPRDRVLNPALVHGAEHDTQFVTIVKAILGFLGQELHDDVAQFPRHSLFDVAGVEGCLVQMALVELG